MKIHSVLLLILMCYLSNAVGQNNATTETSKKINKYLDELEEVGFMGTLLVEAQGVKIISKGYGFSDVEHKIRNSPKTIFDIGSVTKQFTATAILKLEMQGKLSTDDMISKYFKNVPSDKAVITIHDLLRHQAGLISNVGKDYEKINEEEFLNKVFASKLKFDVGTNFAYSNIGYSLLAMIIEKVSEMSYEDYLYKYLWQPSQMEMTGYTRPEFNSQLIAVGYFRNDSIWGKPTDKAWDKNAPYWHLKGNGGILSTSEDMFKWNKILLTDKILSDEARTKLYHPKIRSGESENAIYAYGWDVSKTKRNTTLVWHNGSNRIFYTDFLRFIDENSTVIMFTNKLHPNFDYMGFEIAKMIFNPDYIPEIPIADNNINRDFTVQIIKTIEDSGLAKAKSFYNSKLKGQQLLEFMMRDEGFDHIDNDQAELAVQIFEMNAYAYPNSAKALQGLGEGYMETGKKELALKYFKQSLGINPDNPFVNDMIKKLEE